MSLREHYRPNSELHRCAVEAERNEQRLANWCARYTSATGLVTVPRLRPVLTPLQTARIAANRRRQRAKRA